MRERMFHMVNLIIEHLLKDSTVSFYEPEMAEMLRSHGFDAEEIHAIGIGNPARLLTFL